MPPAISRRARLASCLGALLLLATAAACGGGGKELTQCGNGRLDTGEQCDDGNRDDSDACTAVCNNARCGDGAVQTGVEVCDGGNVGDATCGSLGLDPPANGSTRPLCLDTCADFDFATCGARFTPTPVVPTSTATYTPTATPSPSPTPTLPTGSCGNGLLQQGETCSSCPADCAIAACTPSGSTFTFAVTLQTGGAQPTNARIQLAYRSSTISIPGSGADTSVKQRVRFAPPPPNPFIVFDRNYAVDVDSSRAGGLPFNSAPFVTARFDGCSGAPLPTVDDLTCFLEACSDAAGAIADCQCVVTGP